MLHRISNEEFSIVHLLFFLHSVNDNLMGNRSFSSQRPRAGKSPTSACTGYKSAPRISDGIPAC